MARPQIQLPGFANSQPQASPTDQFVQAKLRLPVPSHIRDLMPFSKTLTEIIAQSQIDTHERQRAQGAADATFTTPFGAGVADSPENDANRKAWAAQIASGKILASESPWYRIGVFEADGRRAGLDVHANVVTPANMDVQAKIYDGHGNFIMPGDREDANAIFQRQAAPFLNVPALQTTYGKNAAVAIVANAQAQFVAGVAERRDRNTQQYHETQLTDQFVAMLDRVAEAEQDYTYEGFQRYIDTREGLQDLVNTSTVGRNVPDPTRILRLAGESWIEAGSAKSPDEGLARIDLFREMPIGTTTVEADNSEAGLALRLKLDAEERRFTDARDSWLTRKAANDRAMFDIKRIESESGISNEYQVDKQSRVAPEATWKRLKDAIDRAPLDGMASARHKINDENLKQGQAPIPDNPGATDELNDRILTKPLDEADAWIDSIKGVSVSPTQARAMHADVAKALEWQSDPDFKLASEGFIDQTRELKTGRSTDAQDRIDALTNAATANANRSIQAQIAGLSLEDRRKQIGAISTKAYADAAKPIEALKADLSAQKKAFDLGLADANAHGQSYESQARSGRDIGFLTTDDFKDATSSNQIATDVSRYTNDPRIKNILDDVFRNKEDLKYLEAPKANDAQVRAERSVQEWWAKERGNHDSRQKADEAFTLQVGKIRADVAGFLNIPGAGEPLSAGSKPGGPTAAQIDQVEAGKQFQAAMTAGNRSLLKLAVEKTYAVDSAQIKPNDAPTALLDFQDGFGSSPKKVMSARALARNDLALLQSKNEVHTTWMQNWWNHTVPVDAGVIAGYKTALLSVGAASPQEYMDGKMTVGGVEIPFTPTEINPWRTPMFTSTVQAANLGSVNPDFIRRMAAKYGITNDDFTTWIDVQKSLLQVNGL